MIGQKKRTSLREKRLKNKERLREWRLKNPEKFKAQVDRYKENIKNGAVIKKTKPRVKGRSNRHKSFVKKNRPQLCSWCKQPLIEDDILLDIDHIIPLWEGGTHSKDNLQLIHCWCHRLKSRAEGLRRWAAIRNKIKQTTKCV